MRERQDGVILQPSDIKHFIITKSDARGPLSTSEVLHYFEQNPEILPSVQWISPESQTPLLLMEWFSDFAPEGELDLILSKAAPAPSSRFGRAKDTSSENSGSGSNAHLSKPSDFLTQKTRHRRWRDWLSLFGLGLLGAAIFAVGVRSLRPHRSLVKNENSLRAKLLSSTPDALRTYQLVLEAKIIRDPKNTLRLSWRFKKINCCILMNIFRLLKIQQQMHLRIFHIPNSIKLRNGSSFCFLFLLRHVSMASLLLLMNSRAS